MNVLLHENWKLKCNPSGISQTLFHGVLIAVFPKEFHDPINVENTELSKIKWDPLGLLMYNMNLKRKHKVYTYVE